MNKNGQKVAKVTSKEGGFSVQTNGNLPKTHKMEKGNLNGVEFCNAFCEIGEHILETGTKRQAEIMTAGDNQPEHHKAND